MHRRRIDLLGDGRNPLFRPSPGHQQSPIQVFVQLPQRVAQKPHPPAARRRHQERIEHKAGEHLVAVGGGPQQRREIAQSQVAAEPQQRGHQRATCLIVD
jgi:hypothetical protein